MVTGYAELAVVESIDPVTWLLPQPEEAEVNTGKFCRLFGPASPSPASFAVTPALPKSIPRPVLSWIELGSMALPVPAVEETATPAPPLKAMVLPELAIVPPMVLL